MDLKRTGVHPPRAGSHPAFQAASKSLEKKFSPTILAGALPLPFLLSFLCTIYLIMNELHEVDLSDMIFTVSLGAKSLAQN